MTNSDRSILITGAAGFIGFHLALRLLREGKIVVALNNLSDYYDVDLKKARLEQCLGLEAKKEFLPLQPRDVPCTCADIEDLVRDFGFRPQTGVREGISQFVKWYQDYYRVRCGTN